MKTGRGVEEAGVREEKVGAEGGRGRENAEEKEGTERGREAKPESEKGNNKDVGLKEEEVEGATLRTSRETDTLLLPKPGATRACD